MPSLSSDIHEIAVLVGLTENVKENDTLKDKFRIFQKASNKYSDGLINITYSEFIKKKELFDRGLRLSLMIKKKLRLSNRKELRWSGNQRLKEDSSDIYCGDIGISLKDSSVIIRNTGFSQLLKIFCPSSIRQFKDPYWEFAPTLSMKYLHTVIQDCHRRRFIEIKDAHIYIDGKKRKAFKNFFDDLLQMNLPSLLAYINKSDIKSLIKDFSKNGDKQKLLVIRKQLVSEVSAKVLVFFSEGILQDSKQIGNRLKYMLQFRDEEKIFGFSSKKYQYVGKIFRSNDVNNLC